MFLVVQCRLWDTVVNIQCCGLNLPYSDLPLLAWNAPLPFSLSCSKPLSVHPGIQVKRLKLLLAVQKKALPEDRRGKGLKVSEISRKCGCGMSEIRRECDYKVNTVGTQKIQE